MLTSGIRRDWKRAALELRSYLNQIGRGFAVRFAVLYSHASSRVDAMQLRDSYFECQ